MIKLRSAVRAQHSVEVLFASVNAVARKLLFVMLYELLTSRIVAPLASLVHC